jgi:DNA polymerase elongation subunit (family B)
MKKDSLVRGEVLPEDLALTSSLTKLPQDYKTVPVHVKAIMNSKRFNYFIGQKISYILIGVDENGRETAMELQDFLEDYAKGLVKPDYELYWERKIFPSIFRILKTVFGEEEVRRHLPLLESRGYQSSIRDYVDKELRLVCRKIYKLI